MESEIDSAAFLLHGMHLAVCTSAFLTNLLLLYLLTRFTVFHHHMKIIMINLTLSVNAAVFYLLIRSTIGLVQIWRKTENDEKYYELPMDPADCAFSESVPQTLCVLFFMFPLILVTERCYATQKFWQYENEHIPAVFGVVCAVLWIPTIVEVLSFLFHLSFPSSLAICQISMLHKTFLQRNIWFIIVSTFCLLFAGLFKFLEMQNKANEDDYVKNHYSTISIRFQIRENIKTCRFAVSLNSLFFVSFLVFFLFDQNNGSDLEDSAMRREYLFLIFPMFALIYAVHFITSHSQLFDKAKRTLRSLMPGQIGLNKEQQKFLQS
ncbi:unnamed protein product [Caenorhabditis angaria]|uniref:G-protein coupled receptors family 1 profile domain-containing protein n=1 Tax=Caenorhabditis angaria TaxID=860376 RepID=A0A9P1N2F4_9PELO|nr:unnamed protein product [Caenorhabditis angaria]